MLLQCGVNAHLKTRRLSGILKGAYSTCIAVMERRNMYQAINEALSLSMESNAHTVVCGEDVEFGGVFRCTGGLLEKFGKKRVFNTPLCEQGIAGFALGAVSQGISVIAEIQFADYIFPAFDQIVNELAKYRYRSGGIFSVGNIVIRAPCGAVGHGGLYHSQSPEAYFAHTPGLKVVVPRGPLQAKGLLLSSVAENDPVLFLEPKVLYRSSVEEVPVEKYLIPLGKADVVEEGTDVTLLGWGTQIKTLQEVRRIAALKGISCEVIDLQTILPWDHETVRQSVLKTGRLIIAHEAPITGGFGAEIAAKIQESCALSLKSPVFRVAGWDTPFPLVFEKFYLPNVHRCLAKVLEAIKY